MYAPKIRTLIFGINHSIIIVSGMEVDIYYII